MTSKNSKEMNAEGLSVQVATTHKSKVSVNVVLSVNIVILVNIVVLM